MTEYAVTYTGSSDSQEREWIGVARNKTHAVEQAFDADYFFGDVVTVNRTDKESANTCA